MAVKSLLQSSLTNDNYYRSMLVGNQAYNPGAFELIETQLISSQTGSVTFSNLSAYAGTYKHLQIRYTVRGTRPANGDGFIIRFNGDTAANYSRHALLGYGTAVDFYGLGSQTYGDAGSCPGTSTPAGTFAGTVLDVLDAFSVTKYKTTRALSGQPGAQLEVRLCSGSWRSLSAVSSITLAVQSGNDIVANSRFSLYGIRG